MENAIYYQYYNIYGNKNNDPENKNQFNNI
jgi:hypothetical protein